MSKYAALTKERILSLLEVDVETGKCYWRSVSKYHKSLNGKEAGTPRRTHSGKVYWVIGIDGIQYKRSYIIFIVSTGAYPLVLLDHIDGNSLNDAISNLRHATVMQNAWNHKKRKKISSLPMGVRMSPSGRFVARIGFNHNLIHIGTFPDIVSARSAYLLTRKSLFGEFA